MFGDRQEQTAGDHSVNVQGATVTINAGLTYVEARQVALDVFRSEYGKLSGKAIETARARVEEVTDRFLEELNREYPEGIQAASDPDFQYALHGVQREFARSGDRELADVLIDLLKERTKAAQRSLVQVVLNESLIVVPKLTTDQLNAISLVFSLRYSKYKHMNSLDALRDYLRRRLLPFLEPLSSESTAYQHIEYAGCGTIAISSLTLEKCFIASYPGLFSRGLTAEELQQASLAPDSPLICNCLHDGSRYQVCALDEDAISQQALALNLDEDTAGKYQQLMKGSLMDEAAVRATVEQIAPQMRSLFECWNKSPMMNLTLTSVGIAIGHSNVRRVTGEGAPLSIWIKA